MSNQTTSWTVHNTRNVHTLDDNNLEALLKVVDDTEHDDYGNRPEPFIARAGGYTKATQVFVSPSPLTPADVGNTPVKDPMESFNAWARGQTPTSNRNSPTPTGGYAPMSRGMVQTPMSASRINMNGLGNSTPAKMGGTPARSGPGLEAIQEHRRQLLQQMEELELQELELRNRQGAGVQGPPTDSLFSVQSRQQQTTSSQGLNPFAASFGAPAPAQPQMTAESIRGRVYETAKDQHGCRFLQRALDSNFDRDMANVIMSEIVPYVPELMTDQYANFLVQKLFDMMPHDVRFNVAKVAAPQMPTIALTAHGTFSVQKLIETITTREEMLVVRDALSADVVRLVVDVHGNHVIQKVLQRFDHPDKQFIYDAVSTDVASIAMNKQGCCVLQRCLEYASPEQHKALVSTILDAALDVVEDPYGNYVVQYVLESDEVEINDRIGLMFLPAISRLAINKFSSNVMERVLRRTSQHVKDKYCEALCDLNTATRLLSDDYGNYVVQTALTTGSPQHVETLTQTIRPVLHTIRNAPYAKKLEAKMDMMGRKKFSPTSGGRGQGGYRNHPFPSSAGMPFAPMGGPMGHGNGGVTDIGGLGGPHHMGPNAGSDSLRGLLDGPMGSLTPYSHGPMQQGPPSRGPMQQQQQQQHQQHGGMGMAPTVHVSAAQRSAIDAAMVDAIGGNAGGGNHHNNSGHHGGYMNTNNNNNNNNTNHNNNNSQPAMPQSRNGNFHPQPSKYTATTQMMNNSNSSHSGHHHNSFSQHHQNNNPNGHNHHSSFNHHNNSNNNQHQQHHSSQHNNNNNNSHNNTNSGNNNNNNNNNNANNNTANNSSSNTNNIGGNNNNNNTSNNNNNTNYHGHGGRGATRGRRF